ncbi:hypothetical protein ILYODFUR_021868 [Ilyodon furcidens]|uniref:Uncharacterized protein n=1 Tax=Ilyodon furcidens TaxID=33524 RepID=A0ABV0SNX4_9TELE
MGYKAPALVHLHTELPSSSSLQLPLRMSVTDNLQKARQWIKNITLLTFTSRTQLYATNLSQVRQHVEPKAQMHLSEMNGYGSSSAQGHVSCKNKELLSPSHQP